MTKKRTRNKVVKTWIDGEVVLAKYAHNYQSERVSSGAMKGAFLANPKFVCWWCGKRGEFWMWEQLNTDHIAPFCYYSPRAICCRWCNVEKTGVLPDAVRIRRLLYADNIVRDLPPKKMQKWVEQTAKEIFGEHPRGISVLLAKSFNKNIRSVSGAGSNDQNRVEWAEEMCRTYGFC